jgi:hypothetical protein
MVVSVLVAGIEIDAAAAEPAVAQANRLADALAASIARARLLKRYGIMYALPWGALVTELSRLARPLALRRRLAPGLPFSVFGFV